MTRNRLRTALFALTGLMLLVTLSACGSKQDRISRSDTEGNYLDVGPLQYQIQLSRQLNPFDTEDRGYLIGIPDAQRTLRPDETWFGVFMRVENQTKRTLSVASDYEIVDTQGNTFRPVAIGPDNLFAYRDGTIPPHSVLPNPESAAGTGPIRGSLLLFRLTFDALANRPLELRIKSPEIPRQEASVDLDV